MTEPTINYPSIFPPGGLLSRYPYLLPNLVSACILILGITVGILFLEETHGALKEKPDIGIIAGRKLVAFFKWREIRESKYEGPNRYDSPPSNESQRLLSGNEEPNLAEGYETFTPVGPVVGVQRKSTKPPPVVKAFTPPVIHLIISYGILAYHTMGFEQLFPVFLYTPPADEPPHHPFKFVGGFGLSTHEIGIILAVQGVVSMLTQFFLFPPLVRYFGSLGVYRFCMITYPIAYITVPYLKFLPKEYSIIGIYFVVVVKILFSVHSYPCNAILLTNAAPSFLVLGAINGVAASTASIFRAFGPTVTGLIYAWGLDVGMIGLAWWVNGGVCVLGGLQTIWMTADKFDVQHPEVESDEIDEEAVDRIAAEVQIAHVGVSSTEGFIDEYQIVKKAAEDEIGQHQQELATSYGVSRS